MRTDILLPLVLAPSLSAAFVPLAPKPSFRSALAAEGGPPKYEKIAAKLIEAEPVGEGSVMLHIGKDGDEVIDYKPGHVLALEIEKPSTASSSLNDKTAQDADQNGGWMRGPYTVSRATDSSLDILIKVVGDKSKIMANAEPGTPMKFGGKFHVPIYEGINKEDTKRVVLISTGVGIGPCIGAIEEMMEDDEFNAEVNLLASFRTDAEVVCRHHLDAMMKENPEKFKWTPIVTSELGRISESEENIKMATSSSFCSMKDTHYHLIGNGQLVNEWKAGLSKAGVPDEKVTVESYFNHKAEVDTDRIDRIAKVISQSALSPAL